MENKYQKGYIASPRPWNKWVAELTFEPRPPNPKAHASETGMANQQRPPQTLLWGYWKAQQGRVLAGIYCWCLLPCEMEEQQHKYLNWHCFSNLLPPTALPLRQNAEMMKEKVKYVLCLKWVGLEVEIWSEWNAMLAWIHFFPFFIPKSLSLISWLVKGLRTNFPEMNDIPARLPCR